MVKNVDELFAQFCTEHNIYAVASFAADVDLNNLEFESRKNNVFGGQTDKAPVSVLYALADACERQSLDLHEFEEDRGKEIDVALSERAWFTT